MLIKMTRDDGHTADVHPEMVDEYIKGGYVQDQSAGGGTTDIPSKSDIATMSKQKCIEWLEAHGAPVDGNVGDLRKRLRAVMFLDDE